MSLMPKMRGIKPEIWTDDKFVELPPLARLLFIGMWNYACDNGHLDDKPKQIKMRVLPTDDADPAELVDDMIELGMVVRSQDGLTIPKLREHQRIDDRYFTWCDRCVIDEIPERSRERYLAATKSARSAHDGSTTGTRRAPTLKEGRKEGTDGEGDGDSTAASKSRNRAIQLPSSWQPTEAHRSLAAERGVDVREEADKFRDWCAANGATKKDWEATFRNWIRNARPSTNVRQLHPEDDTPIPEGAFRLPPLPKPFFDQ